MHEIKKVNSVSEIISELLVKNEDFVRVIKKEMNHGLKTSVINGINQIFAEGHESVITIEDDIVITSNFLNFCEKALDKFPESFSVAGFSFPLLSKEKGIFKHIRFNSWGWAITKENWQKINFDANNSEIDDYLANHKKELLKVSDNFPEFLKFVKSGRIDSWATFASFAALKSGKYTIYPCKPLVKNIGLKDGTHFNKKDPISKIYDVVDVNALEQFPDMVFDKKAAKKFTKFGMKNGLIKSKTLSKLVFFMIGLVAGILISL